MKTNARYRILALLFFATTINYLDRSTIGVLGPTLRDKVFHWSMADYGYMTTAFQLAYSIGLLIMGAVVDRLGVRRGYTVSILIWSFFGLSQAFIHPAFGLLGFTIARFGLGFGEAGNFPSSIKACAEWFPKKERAFAAGIFNAGTNIGAILAPLLIPMVVSDTGEGWPYAFMISAVFSLIWIYFWHRTYTKPDDYPGISKQELEYIHSDGEPETLERVPWLSILPRRETWAFCALKLVDAVWWFYLFWGGMFLADRFHLDLHQLGWPLVAIYVIADLGSIAGGWLSGSLIHQGWAVARARKTTMLIASACIFPVVFATQTDLQWLAVLLIGIAAGGHQAWSANAFTSVSDYFPKKAVASVVGVGGMVGSLTSMTASLILGHTLVAGDAGGYVIPFLIAGLAYPACLLLSHLLTLNIKLEKPAATI